MKTASIALGKGGTFNRFRKQQGLFLKSISLHFQLLFSFLKSEHGLSNPIDAGRKKRNPKSGRLHEHGNLPKPKTQKEMENSIYIYKALAVDLGFLTSLSNLKASRRFQFEEFSIFVKYRRKQDLGFLVFLLLPPLPLSSCNPLSNPKKVRWSYTSKSSRSSRILISPIVFGFVPMADALSRIRRKISWCFDW